MQVAAYASDVEAVLKIALPPPEGEATEPEAEHGEVLLYASHSDPPHGEHAAGSRTGGADSQSGGAGPGPG